MESLGAAVYGAEITLYRSSFETRRRRVTLSRLLQKPENLISIRALHFPIRSSR